MVWCSENRWDFKLNMIIMLWYRDSTWDSKYIIIIIGITTSIITTIIHIAIMIIIIIICLTTFIINTIGMNCCRESTWEFKEFVRFLFRSENNGFMPWAIVRILMEGYTNSEGFTFNFVSEENKQAWISDRTQIPIEANISFIPCEFVIFLMEHNTTGLMPWEYRRFQMQRDNTGLMPWEYAI